MTDILADDLTAIFSVSGEDVTYTPDGGEAKTIKAIVPPFMRSLEDVGDDQHEISDCEIMIRTDATAGIAAPAIGDSVTIAEVEWAVTEIISQMHQTGQARLRVERHERQYKGSPGHKIPKPGSGRSASNIRGGR